jgi:hypothetical protein
MALEITCEPQRTKNPQITLVKVTQRASEDGDRWKRYYEVIAPGWERALHSLKRTRAIGDPNRTSYRFTAEFTIGSLRPDVYAYEHHNEPLGTGPVR